MDPENTDNPLPHAEPNSVGSRMSRLTGGDPSKIAPKHVRMMGGYCVFAASAFAGLNIYTVFSDGTLWPKTVLLFPTLLLLGLWMLIDAKALAAEQRGFRPGLWICIGVGSAFGMAILRTMTGRWF
jgi:hypothetical protein